MTPELVVSIFSILLASDWVGRVVLYKMERKDKNKEKNFVKQDDIIPIQNGVCALLRNEIVSNHRMYTHLGYCQLADKQNIRDIYEAYHALGGNDIATRLKDEILALPEEKEKAQ